MEIIINSIQLQVVFIKTSEDNFYFSICYTIIIFHFVFVRLRSGSSSDPSSTAQICYSAPPTTSPPSATKLYSKPGWSDGKSIHFHHFFIFWSKSSSLPGILSSAKSKWDEFFVVVAKFWGSRLFFRSDCLRQ